MDWKTFAENDPRFGGLYQRVARPTWPTKMGLLAGTLVVAVPLILLLLAGLAIGMLVYFVGSLIVRAGQVFDPAGRDRPPASGEPFPDDDLRENVRVIRR